MEKAVLMSMYEALPDKVLLGEYKSMKDIIEARLDIDNRFATPLEVVGEIIAKRGLKLPK